MTNISKRILISILCMLLISGCGNKNSADEPSVSVSDTTTSAAEESPTVAKERSLALEDGEYLVDFDTDSSMFHVNEACEGKAKLTIKDGEGMLHLVMPSKNVLNLYLGLAENAAKENAELIEPSVETVTYSDEYSEEVYAFDVPVFVIDEEFDLALIGKKEVWYDHKVKISNAEPWSSLEASDKGTFNNLPEGTYQVLVSLEGGTGKVNLESPTKVEKTGDGFIVTLIWSSKYYDYMIVDDVKYLPVDSNEHSVFEIPVADLSMPLNVIADTVAMSTPHEIEYTITFEEASTLSTTEYATQFSIEDLGDGYKCIHVADGTDYILVPKGKAKENFGLVNPVYLPIGSNNIYLAASSVMDLFMTLDSLDYVAACSTKAADFNVSQITKKMESGDIAYVGKYSAPDYESLLSLGCDIAIESTMISHAPKIKEQLETLSIPVFVDRSSYEESPLGRLEWVKVYGALIGKDAEAKAFFDKEVEKMSALEQKLSAEENASPKSVAFFYISSNGYVNVRKPGDYICKMLEIAGGEYALNSIMAETNALSTVNINWEEFYVLAKDADIIIYNGTIDGGLKSVNDLIAVNTLFANFKAVKEGNVYGTSLDMYQESSKIVDVILEMNNVIAKNNLQDNRFILPLN